MASRLPHCLNHGPGEIALRVKMLVSRSRTERPRDLHYSLTLVFGMVCVGQVGAGEAATPEVVEAVVKYHSDGFGHLALGRDPVRGQGLVDSLTGVVASERVTETAEG